VGRVEKMLDAVNTFRGEFVVGEGAEELGDEDVDFVGGGRGGAGGRGFGMWACPCAHVGLHEVNAVLPNRCIVPLEEHVCVGVLLDGPHIYLNAGFSACFKRARDERSSASTSDSADNAAIRS